VLYGVTKPADLNIRDLTRLHERFARYYNFIVRSRFAVEEQLANVDAEAHSSLFQRTKLVFRRRSLRAERDRYNRVVEAMIKIYPVFSKRKCRMRIHPDSFHTSGGLPTYVEALTGEDTTVIMARENQVSCADCVSKTDYWRACWYLVVDRDYYNARTVPVRSKLTGYLVGLAMLVAMRAEFPAHLAHDLGLNNLVLEVQTGEVATITKVLMIVDKDRMVVALSSSVHLQHCVQAGRVIKYPVHVPVGVKRLRRKVRIHYAAALYGSSVALPSGQIVKLHEDGKTGIINWVGQPGDSGSPVIDKLTGIVLAIYLGPALGSGYGRIGFLF